MSTHPQRAALSPRKTTRAESANVAAAADSRRTRTLLAVKGISPGKFTTIRPDDFGHLDVDPAYQRGETTEVNEIIAALQSGGAVLDPVTLCQRTAWGKDKAKMWVVDGHQRVCAFQQLSMPFTAMIHESASLDAEKNFFLALNARRTVGSDVIVKSWTGPGGRIIQEAAAHASHPLYERINFSQGSNEARIGATVLARGALCAATGLHSGGSTQQVLSRLDVALGPVEKRRRAEAYMILVGEIFTKGSMNILIATTLGLTAYARWEGEEPRMPTRHMIDRLRKVNWRQEVPALSIKFRPVLREIIDKIWKEQP